MGVGLCERDHGTHAIGHQLDVPAPRAPSQAGTATKVPHLKQSVLVLEQSATVMVTCLNRDATGMLAPRAFGTRPERLRIRSKTTTYKDLQDCRWEWSLVTGRTSRICTPCEQSPCGQMRGVFAQGDFRHFGYPMSNGRSDSPNPFRMDLTPL